MPFAVAAFYLGTKNRGATAVVAHGHVAMYHPQVTGLQHHDAVARAAAGQSRERAMFWDKFWKGVKGCWTEHCGVLNHPLHINVRYLALKPRSPHIHSSSRHDNLPYA